MLFVFVLLVELLVICGSNFSEKTWRPLSILQELKFWLPILSRDLGLGLGSGKTSTLKWARACDDAGNCNLFSKGSGWCPLAVLHDGAGGSKFDVVPVHSACRTRQAAWALHCPSEVPLAVLVIEKAGYMSGQFWLAGMDAAPARVPVTTTTLHTKWHGIGAAALLGAANMVQEWLEPELGDMGYQKELVQNFSERAVEYHSYKDSTDVTRSLEADPSRYVRVLLPPHLCPSCCSLPATGRLRLVLVRNPYSRLVSYFRMRCLGSESFPGMNSWNDFPTFVRLIGRLRNETDAYKELPISWDHSLKQAGASKDLLFHTRSVSEWLHEVDTGRLGFQALRLENLRADVAAAERRLCEEFAYCESLPAFPHLHRGENSSASFAVKEPANLWTEDLRADVLFNYHEDFEAYGYSPDPKRRKPVPPFCVIVSAHYKQPTRALRKALSNLGQIYPHEAIALVVDDNSPIPIKSLVPVSVPGLEMHILKSDHVAWGPELGAWGLALESGFCDGAKVYALLLSAVFVHARFDFQHGLPCPLSPIWTFPMSDPEKGIYGCCTNMGCPHKKFDNGWNRPEFRDWVMTHLPKSLRDEWSGVQPRGGVQGPSFVASAEGLRKLRSTGVFNIRPDEEWMQQASERLLALAFTILGYEPTECSIEGDLFSDWYATQDDVCHPHPAFNPIVQPGRARRGRFFTKTFGVIPGKKWVKVYLLNAVRERPMLFVEWRHSREHAALMAQFSAPSCETIDAPEFKLPFASAVLASANLPVVASCFPILTKSTQFVAAECRSLKDAIRGVRYMLRNLGLAISAEDLRITEIPELVREVTSLESGLERELWESSLFEVVHRIRVSISKYYDQLRALPPTSASQLLPVEAPEFPWNTSLFWTIALPGGTSSSSSAVRMPSIGIAVRGRANTCHVSTLSALDLGFRRIEIASADRACWWAIGRALASSGVPRSAFFLVIGGLLARRAKALLAALRTSYADLFVFHGPLHEDWQMQWKALERLVDAGHLRALGIAKIPAAPMKDLLAVARIQPAVRLAQRRFHMLGLDAAESRFDAVHALTLSRVGFVTGSDPLIPTLDPHIRSLAEKRRLAPVQLLHRWALHQGIAVSVSSADKHLMELLTPARLFAIRLNRTAYLAMNSLTMLDNEFTNVGDARALHEHPQPAYDLDQHSSYSSHRESTTIGESKLPAHPSQNKTRNRSGRLGISTGAPKTRFDFLVAEDWNAFDFVGTQAINMLSTSPNLPALNHIFHSQDTFVEHLRNVWIMLTMWGQPSHIRLFGLLHGLFGSDTFKFSMWQDLQKGNQVLESIVGSEAAALIFKFGQINETELLEKVSETGGVPEHRISLSNLLRPEEPVEVSPRDVAAMLLVGMASWYDITVQDFPKWLWPGLAQSTNFAALSQRCLFARPYLDAVPQIFENCSKVLSINGTNHAKLLYWAAVANEEMDKEKRISSLATSCQLNPYVAEPHVLLAQVYFSKGDAAKTAEQSQEALRIFEMWGVSWDKRLAFRQWVAFTKLLLLRARRRLGGVAPSMDLSRTLAGRIDLAFVYDNWRLLPSVGPPSPAMPASSVLDKQAPTLPKIVFAKTLPHPRLADYTGLRLFIYDLNSSFHTSLVDEMGSAAQADGSNCDFMLSPCTESSWSNAYSPARQWGAEVIILRKLLSSPFRVADPREADVFVVPYLIATDCRLRGHLIRCLKPQLLKSLFSELKHYNLSTRHKHLFLATADIHSLPLIIQSQALLVSYGAFREHAGHIIVPPAVTEAELQPEVFQDTPESDRDILFWLAQTPNNVVRWLVQNELIEFSLQTSEEERYHAFGVKGHVQVHVMGRTKEDHVEPQSPAKMLGDMKRAMYCPALPAENSAAGTKRFFDVLLAGCIPVVIAFKTVWGSGTSWWRQNGAPVEWSLPFSWKIDWRRLAIEVPVAELDLATGSGFVQSVLRLGVEERRAKKDYLLEVRELLLYDLASGAQDAFSLMMEQLRSALPKLENASKTDAHPIVCDSTPRTFYVYEMPAGAGDGKHWEHTFGEIACRPSSLYHSPAKDCMTNTFNDTAIPPVAVERFFTSDMLRVNGTSVFLQELAMSPIPHGQESLVLSKSAFSACTHSRWPKACHDEPEVGSSASDTTRFVFNCHRVKESHESVPRSSCRLLPPVVHALPRPDALSVAKRDIHWEIVMWACNVAENFRLLAQEFAQSWASRMPAHHVLNVVVYDACSPDEAQPTANGQQPRAPSSTLFFHALALMHAQRRGEPVADAVFVIPDHWVSAWMTPWELRPLHFVNMLSASLDVLANYSSNAPSVKESQDGRERWMLVFDGPPGSPESASVCYQYSLLLSTSCPAGPQMDKLRPQAVAFGTQLLRQASLVWWEAAAANSNDYSTTMTDRTWQPDFGLFIALLAKEPTDGETLIVAWNMTNQQQQ